MVPLLVIMGKLHCNTVPHFECFDVPIVTTRGVRNVKISIQIRLRSSKSQETELTPSPNPVLALYTRLTTRPPFGGHVLQSFFTKNNLSSEDIKKCPNVLLFGIINSDNMSNRAYLKIFGEVLAQTTTCGRGDLFCFCFSLDFGWKTGHLQT